MTLVHGTTKQVTNTEWAFNIGVAKKTINTSIGVK